MFDLSFAEIIFIAVIAVMVVGPRELPVLLKSIGRLLGKLRHYSQELRHYFEALDESGEMRALQKDLQQQATYIKDEEGRLHRAYDLSDVVDSSRQPQRPGDQTHE